MEIGKEINLCGYDWYKIGEENNNTILLMKDVLSAEDIKKICKDDVIMYRNDEVRYSDNIRHNEWEKSYIYKILNGEFLKQNKELADCINEIRLPKMEEIENLEYGIRKASNWYWTCTPYEDNNDGYIKRAFSVDSDGHVGYNDVDNSNAVRPAVSITTSTLLTKINGGENLFDERTIPEKLNIKETMNEVEIQLKDKIDEIIDYLGVSK